MMTKHTPGPWEAVFMSGVHGETAIMTRAPEFNDDDNWQYHPKIASAACMRGGPPREIAEANARLIAASPMLLLMAKRLCAACRDVGYFPYGEDIDNLEAIINKAEGK